MSVKIYAIRNNTSSDTYIGSTRNLITRRFTEHKASHQAHLKGQAFACASHQILTCPTAYIELLEECDEGMRKQREKWWIENTPNVINIRRPVRTAEEKREYHKLWARQSREKLKASV